MELNFIHLVTLKEENDMNKGINKVPANMEDIFAGKKAENEFVDQIAAMRFDTLAEIFRFMEEEDLLTEQIFGKTDAEGKVIFPWAVPEHRRHAGVQPYYGTLGDQSSIYHQESIREHMALVCANLMERGVPEKLAAHIAVLHDCAKKYCAGTNQRGQVCYYGHEYASAYLCHAWLTNMGYEEETVNLLTVIALYHMCPLVRWKQEPEQKEADLEKMAAFYGTDVIGLLEKMAESDEGLTVDTVNTDEARARIARGRDIILKY